MKKIHFFITIVVFFAASLIFYFINQSIEDMKIRVQSIVIMGNGLIVSLVIITFLDLFLLIWKRTNSNFISFVNLGLSISLFILMEYCFINDVFQVDYVMYYSSISTPIVFKFVAIWAGQAGSIMTWMVFNAIVLFFFRNPFKNKKKPYKKDAVFLLACVISLTVFLVFLLVLFYLAPFSFSYAPIYEFGKGLEPVLLSPFMIYHPFFTFIAYAIFLVPFSIIIAEAIIGIVRKGTNSRNSDDNPPPVLLGDYQKLFDRFALKFGWLVMTLSIGLGAYWAKISINWGRYWGWDPVETVSLLPWIFGTAYFHSRAFGKSNSKLSKFNVILIFLSVVFSTLITRGGGIGSKHVFILTEEMMMIFAWILIIGGIILFFTAFIVIESLNQLLEIYKKRKLFMDYLSYFFLFLMAFVCLIGLYIPPVTYLLNHFLPIQKASIAPAYYRTIIPIPVMGLAISLIFCSLMGNYKIKSIGKILFIGLSSVFLISLVIILISMPQAIIKLREFIAFTIYIGSAIGGFFSILKSLDSWKGYKNFFRINGKKIIHVGISLIFIGFLTGTTILTDIFYLTGFFLLLFGMIPSIIVDFIKKAISRSISSKMEES